RRQKKRRQPTPKPPPRRIEMSKTKAGGSSKNGRDSAAKRLGPKVFDGQFVNAGAILVRQRGTRIHPGLNVGRGGDDTLYALASGTVRYAKRNQRRLVDVLVDRAGGRPRARRVRRPGPGAPPGRQRGGRGPRLRASAPAAHGPAD